ncbi:MAG TPA: acetyl-coenzyme A synthetase N-terminal domain-containing protein, partial [Aldersonia sp.]
MSTYVWTPTPQYVNDANVMRLARTHGIDSIDDLRRRSTADIAWYWDAVVKDLGIPFATPYGSVVDTSAGIQFPDWFVGGPFNVVDACLHRWLDVGAPRTAIVHEAEDGTIATMTYGE